MLSGIEMVSSGDPSDPATQLGNDHSTRPAISAAGRYVAFAARGADRVPQMAADRPVEGRPP